MAAPRPAFAVGELAPLAKSMPREEYMRLVMNAFQEAKRKQAGEAAPGAKKRVKPEPPPRAPGEYGEELRAMLYTFGAARSAGDDVLTRLEELAKVFVTRLCARVVSEAEKEEEERQARREGPRQRKGRRAASADTADAAKARRSGRRRTQPGAEGAAPGAADGPAKAEAEAEEAATEADEGDESGHAHAPDAAPGKEEASGESSEAAAAAGKRVVRLEHLARALGTGEAVQRLADIVVALRRRRQEKLRQSLDNEAEAEGDLFPRAMLEAAAGAVGEASVAASVPPSLAAGVLTEAFWRRHAVDERAASAARLRRLQRRDELTRALPAGEYLAWAECAKASFTKPKRRRKFAAWAGLDGARLAAGKELVDALGQLAYEHLEATVAAAVAAKGLPPGAFPALALADLPAPPPE